MVPENINDDKLDELIEKLHLDEDDVYAFILKNIHSDVNEKGLERDLIRIFYKIR